MIKIEKQVNDRGYLLGVTKDGDYVYMEKFSWDCGWYWGGGYLHFHKRNNRSWNCHTHFDSIFFNNMDKDNKYNIDKYRDMFEKSALTEDEWWRLFDLMKQFYSLRECAEVFQYGGHMTSKGRTENELNPFLASELNNQIKTVIIPEVYKIFKIEE